MRPGPPNCKSRLFQLRDLFSGTARRCRPVRRERRGRRHLAAVDFARRRVLCDLSEPYDCDGGNQAASLDPVAMEGKYRDHALGGRRLYADRDLGSSLDRKADVALDQINPISGEQKGGTGTCHPVIR